MVEDFLGCGLVSLETLLVVASAFGRCPELDRADLRPCFLGDADGFLGSPGGVALGGSFLLGLDAAVAVLLPGKDAGRVEWRPTDGCIECDLAGSAGGRLPFDQVEIVHGQNSESSGVLVPISWGWRPWCWRSRHRLAHPAKAWVHDFICTFPTRHPFDP
jgi:hypothetical protein